MTVVDPFNHCVLMLDERTGFPRMTLTAKAALYHMLKDRGYGLDANKTPFRFADMRGTSKVSVYADQPIMRSAPNAITGDETIWVIPTIFIPTRQFWYGAGRKQWTENNLPSLRVVYDHYKHICQRCLRPIRNIKDASRDHWFPRKLAKADGGKSIDSIVNITLMCRRCNSDLGHTFPKHDVNGQEIQPKLKAYPNHWTPAPGQKIWPGWADHAPWLEEPVEIDLTR